MNLEEQYHAAAMLRIAESDGRRIAELEAERDNAWTELREIRTAISANPEESTLDEVVKLRQQLAAAQSDAKIALEKAGEACTAHADSIKQVALLRDAITEGLSTYKVPMTARIVEALAATEQVTNTRRRNADDMGNPPANAAELLNAWKTKP